MRLAKHQIGHGPGSTVRRPPADHPRQRRRTTTTFLLYDRDLIELWTVSLLVINVITDQV